MENDSIVAIRPSLDEAPEWYRILYYGDPGQGKTTAIAAAARMGKVVYIDADGGLKKKALQRHDIPTGNIEPVTDVTYDALIKLHEELHNRLADGERIFALAWDTSTKSQELFLDEVMPRSLKKSERVGKDRSEFEVYLEDRGEVVQMMTKLLRRFHGLPCHLIIGAHQRRDIDEEDGTVRIGPALSPSVAASFNGWLDCIIHCRTEVFEDDPKLAEYDGEEFMGLTRREGRFTAKDRFGILPKRMINPWFDRAVAYLDGELLKGGDPLQNDAIARRKRSVVEAKPAKDEPETDQPEREPDA